ncbi:NAD(P)-binding protein [Camillea tinctor]|nr:NAD(P)-binding protein [Camillea tinctor]
MSGLVVLGDAVVHEILMNLSKVEILKICDALTQCLIDFSVGSGRSHQPGVGVVSRPEGQRCLFRSFSSPQNFGTKLIVTPAPASKAVGSLHGVIAVCDANGVPSGIPNAEEVTGYRAALSALISYLWRRCTDNIVVFGAGKQALWHVRLALFLRGDEIKSIVVVNRTVSRAEQLLAQAKPNAADAVLCTVGTTEPLFPASFLTGVTTKRSPYIPAVGSWQPHMIELDPDLLRHATTKGGSVLVDDREGALKFSGEVIRSKGERGKLIEVGGIASQQWNEGKEDSNEEVQLKLWIKDGLVIYKSIGVSTTGLIALELSLPTFNLTY